MSTKIIRDPVHGYVDINSDDLKFIDTFAFQRLRRIRQSGCYTVYPSANHTRFEHSIGVMYLGTKVFETLQYKLENGELEELEKYKTTVRYASLLHDVGHTPLSHTGEVLFNINQLKNRLKELTGLVLTNGSEHEFLSCIISIEVFGEELNSLGYDQELFCRMVTGNPYPTRASNNIKNGIIEILNSSIDVDKLDYFSRDSFSSGTSNTLVSIDTERLVKAYNIVRGRLCFDHSALSVVSNFVYARNTLHMWVYNHHVTIYTDHILQRFLKNLIQSKPIIQERYFSIEAIKDRLVDDYDIYKLFKTFSTLNDLCKNLYEQLYSRKLYKPVWKNQFDLKQLFSRADSDFDAFRETDPSNIEEDLLHHLGIDEGKLFVIRAKYKFTNPKVYLNKNGTTTDFNSIFQSNIYSSLVDKFPMVYIHPDLRPDDVKAAIQEIYR